MRWYVEQNDYIILMDDYPKGVLIVARSFGIFCGSSVILKTLHASYAVYMHTYSQPELGMVASSVEAVDGNCHEVTDCYPVKAISVVQVKQLSVLSYSVY